MKKIIVLIVLPIAIGIPLLTTAQDYSDSLITFKCKQKTAFWVAAFVKQQYNWDNKNEKNAPTQLRPYVGSGENMDSVFTVTMKAKYLLGAMELLISQPLMMVYDDYRSIVLGTPTVSGYTGLAAQITTIANGSGPQKATAEYLKKNYFDRVDQIYAPYAENKQRILDWVN